MKMSLALLALCLPIAAQAVSNRDEIRPDRSADMEIVDATGRYKNVQSVVLTLLADGRGNPQGFMAEIDGEVVNFNITKVSKSGCGDTYKAISRDDLMNPESSTLAMRDMSRALCERVINYVWEEVTIITKDKLTRRTSKLVLQGNPEGVFSIQ